MPKEEITEEEVIETEEPIEGEEPVEDDATEPVEDADEPVEESEESEPAEDEYADESEYLAQFREDGLPENIESIDGLIQDYLKVTGESKQLRTVPEKLQAIDEHLKRFGYEGGIDAFLNDQPRTQTAPQYSQPDMSQLPTFTSELDAAVRRGEVDGEWADGLKPVMRTQDKLLTGIYGAINALAGMIDKVSNTTGEVGKVKRDLEWNGFDLRDKFDKRTLDQLRDRHNFKDYTEAARYLMATDPQRFSGLVNDIEKKAETKVRKKLRDTRFLRKTKGGQKMTGKPNWKPYKAGPGVVNEDKLNADIKAGRLKESDWEYICDEIDKEFRRSGA